MREYRHRKMYDRGGMRAARHYIAYVSMEEPYDT